MHSTLYQIDITRISIYRTFASCSPARKRVCNMENGAQGIVISKIHHKITFQLTRNDLQIERENVDEGNEEKKRRTFKKSSRIFCVSEMESVWASQRKKYVDRFIIMLHCDCMLNEFHSCTHSKKKLSSERFGPLISVRLCYESPKKNRNINRAL